MDDLTEQDGGSEPLVWKTGRLSSALLLVAEDGLILGKVDRGAEGWSALFGEKNLGEFLTSEQARRAVETASAQRPTLDAPAK